jgi:hypothetical protein
MTPKIKPLLALTVTAMTFCALASSAGAASLFVGGAKLSAGSKAALNTKIAVEEPFILTSPGLSLAISCSGSSASQPELVGEATIATATFQLETCSEIEPSTCKLGSAAILTEPVTGKFTTGTSPADLVAFVPKAGKTLATITFTGTCSFAGEKPLDGKLTFNAPTGQNEEISQAIVATGSTESLELGGQPACFASGKGLLKLASGSKWSYH